MDSHRVLRPVSWVQAYPNKKTSNKYKRITCASKQVGDICLLMHHRYNNKLLLLKTFRIEENMYSYISQGKCIYDKNTGIFWLRKKLFK